jgi:anti-sigma factor RsiW
MDNWTDKLSEYIDGELDATSAAALEQHLRGCEACSAIVADLRVIAAGAAALPDATPANDLWSGIAAQIGAPAGAAHSAEASGTSADARVISLDAHRSPRRSVTLSMPQLAAAAVVLLALGGTAVWQMHPSKSATVAIGTRTNSDTAALITGGANNATGNATGNGNATAPAAANANDDARTPMTGGSALRVVSRAENPPVPTYGYDAAIQQLQEAADQNETQLDPKTKAVIAQSMMTIDRAIADARAALADDPANAYLHRHLDRTMKQKLELLRQAAKIDRGGA